MADQNEIKTNLTNELANVLKNAVSEYPSGSALSNESTQTLCNVLEAIFIHGLRNAFFMKKPRGAKYPDPNFWPFVSKYTHKAVLDQIAASNQIKTEVGKSRAWIRILLNENTMENYLNLLSRNTAALSKFYEKWAFLRDAERMNVLSGYTKGITRLFLNAAVNSSFLNVWTPTPLILSGLMPGKPARLEQLIKHRRRGGSLGIFEDTEVAENALESLADPTDLCTSLGYEAAYSLEDDQSSVYSHPSMLDGGITSFSVPDIAGSSVLSNPVPEDSALNYDPHQIRVIRRTHRRVRRSSVSSSSSGSSKREATPAKVNEPQKDLKEVEKVVKEAIEGVHEKMGLAPSITVTECAGSGEKEGEKETTSNWDDRTKVDKSFESGNELSSSRDSKSSHSDSKDSTADDLDQIDTPKLMSTMQERTYQLYSLCPGMELGDEEPSEAVENDAGIKLLRKELDIEQIDSNATTSSSASTNSSRNFDLEIRNVLDEALTEVAFQNHADGDVYNDKIAISEETEQLMKADSRTSSSNRLKSPGSEQAYIDSNDVYSESSDESLITVLTTIPREKGLDAQNFRCPSCRKSIGPTFALYRKCCLDEKYYCEGCWNKGEESVIPSRLVHNWDGHARPVCRRNMAFIESIRDKAVFRIDKINPKLYKQSHALSTVKFLREKLALSVMYLFSCRNSVAEDLEQRVWPKDYLYKDVHLYSFADLLTVLSGQMERHLNNLLNFTIEHIRRCVLCAQKGFICEICSSAQVIYPFQLEVTSRCLECYSVYHKDCLGEQRCPKCVRRARYSLQQPNVASDHLLLDID